MKRHCPFCHKEVFFLFYPFHFAAHTQLLPDGQYKDHQTVPPDQRYKGSLEGVPQTYYHSKCGVATGMPEEIVRSYLVNPFLYSPVTFCCGCNAYVPMQEVIWIETKERLSDYMARLQQQATAKTID